ncbi:MAG: sulfite exporter TauE/SafE family protein [Rhodocyclaceae bacterium]|nr:sulfite exporter TauE/SafE family protein [Rhodocyclaceae bacterium]MBX3668481.1 sulfite exporter TauE/SafE family protein [Rhodocyclaceae bacterium]
MDATTIGFGLGAIVGLILALTGAGGGILAVPLLVFGLHLSIAEAAPVGLIAVGLASALGAGLGLREGIVRYRAAALVGSIGMLVAPLGVWLAHIVPGRPLAIAFSMVLAYVGLRMFRQSRAEAVEAEICRPACVVNSSTGRLSWTAPCARALAGTGALSGLLSGLLGVGGGFVIVPALTRFSDLAPRSILATSLAVITLVSIGSVAAAAAHGGVAWGIAIPFALGAALALLLGRQIASRVAGARLQQAFALACWCVAMLLAVRVITSAAA